MKKTLALLLALCMMLSVFAVAETAEPVYTYNDSVSTLASNWNQHTYQTTDDSYPHDFIASGLYNFIFNDELNPKEGLEPYAGYVIVPEMAASMPVDVTVAVREAHPEFGIPASAEKGYAYQIDLNPDAKWQDGTPITADDYIESMKRLLDPKMKNYRAADYTAASNDFVIANGEAYVNQGSSAVIDNSAASRLTLADLTKADDGNYYTPDNEQVFIAVNYPISWTSGDTLKDYVDGNGAAYFGMDTWDQLVALMDDNGMVPLTDANLELFLPVITGNPAWGETADNVPDYLVYTKVYPEMAWENVGIMKTGDYQITLALGKSLSGFYLLYNLSGNWIVKTDVYDACITESAPGVFTNSYCTAVENTWSYGPYKMTYYQTDKQMIFEKNENWYGWTDGKHVFVDPVDGETYPMYQTDRIVCDVVAEASTRKQMFLNGQLIGYGLQPDDMDTYRTSEYAHVTPGTTIFFLIVGGYEDMLNQREAAADFDQTTTDLQTMLNLNFRKALALVYDRVDFVNEVQPSRNAGYALIGTGYIADPESGLQYRDTAEAQQALCDFYSVDTSKYESLKEAVASITGYDPVKAKELLTLAFEESLAAGYITDNDGDGICDQTVTLTYSMSSDNDFMTNTLNYLNTKVQEVAAGTPFDGKILFVKSAPLSNAWSTALKEGRTDVCLAGWSGSALNPYSVMNCYTNPSQQYDANWFDATTVKQTINMGGVDVTMNLSQWCNALNGSTVTVDGVDYNFGADQASQSDRLKVLAALEGAVLQTYNYLPMIQDGSVSLLSQKVFYVVEEYSPVMGRGGLAYLRYNYNDAEWDAYVAECGGTLTY